MSRHLAIVGGGITGRWLGKIALERGFQVTVFDDPLQRPCSITAAGMISPVFEVGDCSRSVSFAGQESLALWSNYCADHGVFFQQRGALCLAFPGEESLVEQQLMRIRSVLPEAELLEGKANDWERELPPWPSVYSNEEGQVDAQNAFQQLGEALLPFTRRVHVEKVEAFKVHASEGVEKFDHVFDCRGLGAKADYPLRGVRGEILHVHAPEVQISRPIRIMHPRYPFYIAPRPGGIYYIGATCLESESLSPVTVRTVLEFLSGAYGLHSGFAEGKLIHTETNLRPALPSPSPQIFLERGLTAIHGMYRHGFMLAPALGKWSLDALEGEFNEHWKAFCVSDEREEDENSIQRKAL